ATTASLPAPPPHGEPAGSIRDPPRRSAPCGRAPRRTGRRQAPAPLPPGHGSNEPRPRPTPRSPPPRRATRRIGQGSSPRSREAPAGWRTRRCRRRRPAPSPEEREPRQQPLEDQVEPDPAVRVLPVAPVEPCGLPAERIAVLAHPELT